MRGMRLGWLALGVALTAVASLAYAAGQQGFDARELRDELREALREPRFWLRRVDFIGLRTLDARALWARAQVRAGTPLVDLEPAALCGAVAGHARVASCRAARVPPDRLVIEIDERVPIARDASKPIGLDASGARFPLEAGEAESLPRVSGDPTLALPLLRSARERGLSLDAVEARPGDLRVWPRDRELLVRLGADVGRSLDAWEQVHASGLIEAYGARELDLRFSGDAILRGIQRKQGGG